MEALNILDKIAVKFQDKQAEDRNITINYKEYPKSKKIPLAKYKSNSLFEKIITDRVSERSFSSKKIPFEILSKILFFASGKKSETNPKRFYPSAGATYPLEIYLVNQTIDSINKGIYHYNVKENCLELLTKGNPTKLLKNKIVTTFLNANLVIITSRIERTSKHYGLSSVQLNLLEAGHLAQNICLLCTEKRLNHCPVGGFNYKKIANELNLDEKEIPIYIIAFGGKNEH